MEHLILRSGHGGASERVDKTSEIGGEQKKFWATKVSVSMYKRSLKLNGSGKMLKRGQKA